MTPQEIKELKEKQLARNIDFQGLLINYYEDQTMANCIDLGFGTDKSKKIIEIMREKNIEYMSRKVLENYRNI